MKVRYDEKNEMKKSINSICLNCERLNDDCGGTTNHSYTGCIYKVIKGEK